MRFFVCAFAWDRRYPELVLWIANVVFVIILQSVTTVAQTCRDAALREWCEIRCRALQAWLGLCLGSLSLKDEEQLAQYDSIHLWAVCVEAEFGAYFARATEALKRSSWKPLEQNMNEEMSNGIFVSRTEDLLRRLFSTNMSLYLHPATLSFALFCHVSAFLTEMRHRFEPVQNDDHKSLAERIVSVRASLKDGLIPLDVGPGSVVVQSCSLAGITILLARADGLRLEAGESWDNKAGNLVNRWLAAAQTCMRHLAFSPVVPSVLQRLSESDAPIFEVLDRLEAKTTVLIDVPSTVVRMKVLPSRNIESNYVRAYGRFHCDETFQSFVRERRQAFGHDPFLIVEVGAHLGGCTLYSLTHLDRGVKAIAIEPYEPAADAMQATRSLNALEERMTVVRNCVGIENSSLTLFSRATKGSPWLHQPDWASPDELEGALPGLQSLKCRSLMDILEMQHVFQVDVLRIHVLGRELSVLQSLKTMLKTGAVRAVAVALAGEDLPYYRRHNSLAIAKLLQDNGYLLRYSGLNGGAVLHFLSKAVLHGTTTLRAEHQSSLTFLEKDQQQ